MNSSFSSILAFGFHSLLVNRLQKAFQLQKNFLEGWSELSEPTSNEDFPLHLYQLDDPIHIPLNRVKTSRQISYVSAIALKLAGQSQDRAVTIAQNLSDRLNQTIETVQRMNEPQPLDRVWQNFKVQAANSGWISLGLTDRGLAEWLQALVNQRMHLNQTNQDTAFAVNLANDLRNSTSTFDILYTHVRCCSLLRSAVKQGLLQFSSPISSAKTAEFNIVSPSSFPWLLENFDTLQFRAQHPSEGNLIEQFVTVLDEWANSLNQPHQLYQLAQILSHRFQDFDAACRIWGEIQQTDLCRVQVRLGLVLITQKILQALLQDMGIEAPIDL